MSQPVKTRVIHGVEWRIGDEFYFVHPHELGNNRKVVGIDDYGLIHDCHSGNKRICDPAETRNGAIFYVNNSHRARLLVKSRNNGLLVEMSEADFIRRKHVLDKQMVACNIIRYYHNYVVYSWDTFKNEFIAEMTPCYPDTDLKRVTLNQYDQLVFYRDLHPDPPAKTLSDFPALEILDRVVFKNGEQGIYLGVMLAGCNKELCAAFIATQNTFSHRQFTNTFHTCSPMMLNILSKMVSSLQQIACTVEN